LIALHRIESELEKNLNFYKPKLWVLMPVFNEANGLVSWIRTVDRELHFMDTTFVIADDGSSDGIGEKLKMELDFSRYVFLSDGINRGPGAAFAVGFEYILQNGSAGDAIITLEADGTADLATLHPMLDALKTHDVAMASVYLPGGGFTKTGWVRMMLSNLANALTRTILNLPYRTLTSFYRAYRFDALQHLTQRYPRIIEETGFICQVELLYKCRKVDLSITEIPTKVFSDRRKGPSKMKIMRTILEHLRFVLKTKLNA
jgi:dolichol-phosphate mannosyltransferase